MTSYQSLTAAAQDIAYFNYTENSKIFILGILFIYCFSYLFYFKEMQKETVFLCKNYFRFVSHIFSVIFLISIPLQVFNLAPQIDFWVVYNFVFTLLYRVVGILFIIFLGIDIFFYGFMGFMGIMGIKVINAKKIKQNLKEFIPGGLLYGRKGN